MIAAFPPLVMPNPSPRLFLINTIFSSSTRSIFLAPSPRMFQFQLATKTLAKLISLLIDQICPSPFPASVYHFLTGRLIRLSLVETPLSGHSPSSLLPFNPQPSEALLTLETRPSFLISHQTPQIFLSQKMYIPITPAHTI